MRELFVTKNDAGQRLDRFVGKAVPLLPESLLQKYIRLKRIKVNGRRAKRDLRLAEGDVVQLYINDEFFEKPSENNAYLKIVSPKLSVIYEDEDILLVDKPPGMLCHSAGNLDTDNLVAHIQAYAYQSGQWNPRAENSFAPALCNRIDWNTGGIVIAAKNAEALRIINQKIRDREIDKYYLCIVHGRPMPTSGALRGFIVKDEDKNLVRVKDYFAPGSKLAETEYRTLATVGGLSLLECRLLTGRTHQIRAQLAAAGHPLLGDIKYGGEKLNKPYGERNQALYSYKLVFSFKTHGGSLERLKNKSFTVPRIDFVEKYFNFDFLH
ncbi:MAG: RluA family pseudouridine synthase [Oscillospiraceae bacterium]